MNWGVDEDSFAVAGCEGVDMGLLLVGTGDEAKKDVGVASYGKEVKYINPESADVVGENLGGRVAVSVRTKLKGVERGLNVNVSDGA